MISTAELRGRLTDPELTIADVRPIPAYNGWRLSEAARGGHIPGAVDAESAIDDVSASLDDLSSSVDDLSGRLDDLETGGGDQASSSVDDVANTVSAICDELSGYGGALGDIYLAAC